MYAKFEVPDTSISRVIDVNVTDTKYGLPNEEYLGYCPHY